MTAPGILARLLRGRRLAIAAVLVWTLGSIASHWIGAWQGVGGVALALLPLLAAVDRQRLAPLLRPSAGLGVTGAAAGGVMVLGTYALYPVARALHPGTEGWAVELYRTFGGLPLPLVAVLLPLVVVLEELLWRGVLPDALPGGPGARVLGSATLYALGSLPIGSPLLVVVAFCCGIYWGALREWTRSLIPSLLAHGVWTTVVIVLVPLVRVH